MNTARILCSTVLLCAVFTMYAQRGINYKAIIHDDLGGPLANTSITVKFTILENGTTAVYQETHTPDTDANGIINVNIGEASTVSGNFEDIDWGSHPHFLKTEVNTGEGFTDMGTTEFKTVPYALHADNGFSGSWTDLTDKPTTLIESGITDVLGSSNMVAGMIDENGYVVSGQGFVVEIIEETRGGEYFKIHFENTFRYLPTLIVSDLQGNGNMWVVPYRDSMIVTFNDGSTFVLSGLSFMAIGDLTQPDMPMETVTDIENHTYSVVQIGSQKWMTENLRTRKYNDGTLIPFITDPDIWTGLTEGAFTYNWAATDFSFEICGIYYNWYAVNQGNLCPAGWHVPTDMDWQILETYLGMDVGEANSFSEDGAIWTDRGVGPGVGNQLKTKTNWIYPSTGTNESGFSARPAGYTQDGGWRSEDIRKLGLWWTASEYDGNNAILRWFTNDYEGVVRHGRPKTWGVNVRCVRDAEPATIPSP